MNVIGRCKIDVGKIREKMPDVIVAEREQFKNSEVRTYWGHVYSLWGENQKSEMFKKVDWAYDRTFPRKTWGKRIDVINKFNENLEEWLAEMNAGELVIKCYYRDDVITIVGFTDSADTWFMFPTELVNVEEYRNYDYLTGAERRNLLTGEKETINGNSGNIMEADELSKSDLVKQQTDAQTKMDVLKQQIQDVKDAKVEGLAELQAEIDAKKAELESKKQNMMAVLNQKKAEMELALEKMEFEIFKLDSEIYAIRCYTGEVLELKRIISGKSASPDTPLIFHQKMRYLDEELGKLASLYRVDYSDAKRFEEILKVRKDIAEYFAPTERSIMLIRVSRTNNSFLHTDETNILDCYNKYHGKKVGIIIRDGENLYMAWTDDERVYFADDAFYKPGETEASAADFAKLEKSRYETEEDYRKRIRSEKMRELRNQLGRYYVFTLLQGMIDRNLILFPEQVNIRTNSRYIIWSYADGWITTNEYGTFSDMIDRCNSSIKAGDMILTVDSIRPQRKTSFYGGPVSQSYHNDRGRGDANRTHDVHARNNTIYPVNLVEHSAKYSYKCYDNDEPEEIEDRDRVWSDAEYKDIMEEIESGNGNRAYTYKDIKKIEGTDEYQYYISLEKRENWMTGKSSRANFEVYPDEFINLTFMNSVWLIYVLTNHKTSGIKIHGEAVDFAHLIPYIKTALEYVRKREEQVAEWIKKIDSSVLDDEKWLVKLSEWMLEKDIHNFSEFRTKQFMRWYHAENAS